MNTVTRDEYEARLKDLLYSLRSGTYPQTIGKLRGDHGFCCLGVACDVFQKLTSQGSWEKRRTNLYKFQLEDEFAETMLPDLVRDYFGFNGRMGSYETDKTKGYLTDLNDINDWDFNKIADFIEAHKKELFKWA